MNSKITPPEDFGASNCSVCVSNKNTLPIDIFFDRKSYGDHIHPSSAALLLFQYAGMEVNSLLWECLKKADEENQLEYYKDSEYGTRRVVYKPSIQSFGEFISDSKF